MEVDCATHVAFEAGVEEVRRIGEGRALGEGGLNCGLIGFPGANNPVVVPGGDAAPLPLFDDVGQRLLD